MERRKWEREKKGAFAIFTSSLLENGACLLFCNFSREQQLKEKNTGWGCLFDCLVWFCFLPGHAVNVEYFSFWKRFLSSFSGRVLGCFQACEYFVCRGCVFAWGCFSRRSITHSVKHAEHSIETADAGECTSFSRFRHTLTCQADFCP